MAASPAYTATPRTERAAISAANTNRDGTGTIVNLFTAGANGSRVERITICATGTTTAGMIRFYLYDGTNTDLWREIPVTAITPSATVAAFYFQLGGLGFILNSSTKSLRVSTHNAESFRVIAEGGDF
jgi:hypothetical protein